MFFGVRTFENMELCEQFVGEKNSPQIYRSEIRHFIVSQTTVHFLDFRFFLAIFLTRRALKSPGTRRARRKGSRGEPAKRRSLLLALRTSERSGILPDESRRGLASNVLCSNLPINHLITKPGAWFALTAVTFYSNHARLLVEGG